MPPSHVLAATLVAVLLFPNHAGADEPCNRVSPNNLVYCAVRNSLRIRAQTHEKRAVAGRVEAASTVLPSMPVLSLTAARRMDTASDRTALNWSATLSQELEIGGQRSARLRAAGAAQRAQKARLTASERAVAAQAWLLFFDVLAAHRELQIAMLAESIANEAEKASTAMTQAGTLSGSDSDTAVASALQTRHQRLDAERRVRAAELELSLLVTGSGGGTRVRTEGELAPLPGVEAHAIHALARTAEVAPDVRIARAESEAFAAEAERRRKERIPNLTLSVFFQRDGFDENVYGGGLALPLYLPGPLGPTQSGEIAEAEALAGRAKAEAARLAAERRAQLFTALDRFRTAQAVAELYRPERVASARRTLADIAEQIRRGTLSLREGSLVRQPLLQLLRAEVDAQRELALASVELAEVSGFRFPGAKR